MSTMKTGVRFMKIGDPLAPDYIPNYTIGVINQTGANKKGAAARTTGLDCHHYSTFSK